MNRKKRDTKTQKRHDAQDDIMLAIQARMMSEEDADKRAAMQEQMRRIEKLFGYEVGSWWAE